MNVILIVKALAGTLVTVPFNAPPPTKGFGGMFPHPCFYARYAPELHSTVYCNYVHTILRIIITDEDNNENANEQISDKWRADQ